MEFMSYADLQKECMKLGLKPCRGKKIDLIGLLHSYYATRDAERQPDPLMDQLQAMRIGTIDVVLRKREEGKDDEADFILSPYGIPAIVEPRMIQQVLMSSLTADEVKRVESGEIITKTVRTPSGRSISGRVQLL